MKNKKEIFKEFLKIFLEKYPIDFQFLNSFSKKNPKITCISYEAFEIILNRFELDTYGGGKAIKTKGE